MDITQDKYCTNDVWSRIDHMEYSYDYDIRQTAEYNRKAKINNFMSKAPALPEDADEEEELSESEEETEEIA